MGMMKEGNQLMLFNIDETAQNNTVG